MTELVNFFLLYASTISYAIFFHYYYDRTDTLKDTLLFFIPLTVVFYIVLELSYLIPNEFAGMIVKTICCRIIFVLYFRWKLKIKFLTTLMQTYIVSFFVVFSQLTLSLFADLSYYTNYLSMEQPVLFTFFFSLLSNIIENICVFITVKLIRKYNIRSSPVPARYILIALASLALISTEGAILFYFNTSSAKLSLPFIVLLVILTVTAASLPLHILSNQERLKHVLSFLPEFVSTQDHLNKQLAFLDRQTNELLEAHKSLDDYKAKGDFSVSVNDVFHSQEEFIERLYTDNPVINTLLMDYADLFEQGNIRYSFDIRCSTYTGFSDYFMIYLFSGLLDTARQTADLSLSRTANIYSFRFRTDESAKQEIRAFLKSASLLSAEYQTMSSEEHDNTLQLNLSPR